MRSEPYITVTCDGCHDATEIVLTEIPRGAWDDRHVDDELEREGWFIDGDSDYCEACTEELALSEPTDAPAGGGGH